jgi:hypothetical protein
MVTAWRGRHWVTRAKVGSDGSFVVYVPADEPDPVRLEVHAHGSPGGLLRGQVEGVLPGASGVAVLVR